MNTDKKNKSFLMALLYPCSSVLIRGLFFLVAVSSFAFAADIKLVSLRTAPEQATLYGPQSTQHVLVLGKYSDGLERDVTALATWSTGSAVKVDSLGRVTPLADGDTTLTATVEGQSAQSTVSVRELKTERPLTFVRD